jgi:hypothetical protein
VRIDPNATVAGHPALVIRRTLRRLRGRLSWGLADLETAAALNPGEGRALAKALRAARFIEGAGRGAWVITQAGQTYSLFGHGREADHTYDRGEGACGVPRASAAG